MNFRQWIKARRMQYAFASSYWLNEYRETIWLLGDGRSGTTWVSELINHDGRYREVFEPVHPQKIEAFSFIQPHQYIRPGSENPLLEAACASLFSGKFTHPRTDFNNRSYSYNGLLIKDIFANLMACWVADKFPTVRPVFLLRNPFAVALSKQKRSNWFWATEPADLLQQQDLREDYLLPFEDLILRTSKQNDFVINQILIWSIIHYIPARQFAPKAAHFVFYEHIFTDPEQELASLMRFARGEDAAVPIQLDPALISKPSLFSGKNSTLSTGGSPLTDWKSELKATKIDAGLQILDAFGLAELYDSDGTPHPEKLFTP